MPKGERTAAKHTLEGKTLFVSGGSRGIGLAIAVRAAQDGANVAIAAKTVEPHPKLTGTIHTAASAVDQAGGTSLAIACDIRDESSVRSAVEATVARFGGIDILVNNASAISLTGTLETPMKRFDLMHEVNVRGTFLCSQACLPHLKASAAAGRNPHILTLSPPPNLSPKWFKDHVAYTIAKYGMSLCVLGMAEEFRSDGIGINALWPRTVIATAAIAMIPGASERVDMMRRPAIVADAAHVILTRDARTTTGNFFIDEKVLAQVGIKDLSRYAIKPGAPLLPDLFLD
ncbi:MAG TPA: NAD(P)-dependent oxidoreductase [Casimicrobiaceae bacterium]|nr:NAD(P)-dependent oxidoreductase [Casimicrobiaceae bacterium]